MRVERIDLYSNDLEIVRFDVDGPNPMNSFVMKGVTGLGADDIIPRFYGEGANSGTKFHQLTLQPREVAIKVGLVPDYAYETPGDLRTRLLKAIASNRSGTVQLRFYESETVVGVLNGFVIKFDDTLTAKESEVTLTIKCNDPIIKSLNVTSQILDDLSVTDPVVNDPVSTSPHGFSFKAKILADTTQFRIEGPTPADWTLTIDYAFLTDDEIWLSSEDGNKYIYRFRSGTPIGLMDVLDPASVWPVLFPGENVFQIGAASIEWLEMNWYETHWGI
jgi:hypothetical protein